MMYNGHGVSMMTTIQEDKDYLMCSPSGNFGAVQKFPACIASKRNSSEGDLMIRFLMMSLKNMNMRMMGGMVLKFTILIAPVLKVIMFRSIPTIG